MYQENIVEQKSTNKDLITIAIFLWIAALMVLFIPIFAIPFAVVAVVKAFYSKSTLCKFASILVAAFVTILIIYWLVNVVNMLQESLDEMMSQLIRIG